MRAFILLLLVAAFLLAGCSEPIEESFTHTIDYSVSVTFGELQGDVVKPPSVDEIENVTVIVPLPALDYPIDIENLSCPKGWKAEIVETPYGEMLKLSGEKVKTWVMSPMPVPVEEGSNATPTPTMVKRAASYDFELTLRPDREINTLNPIEGEFVLKPKFDLREVGCPEEYTKHYRNVKCYEYTTMLFYSSDPAVNADVVVWLNGRNNWFQMGWTGNEFDDYFFAHPNSSGWHEITGKLETGQGVYIE